MRPAADEYASVALWDLGEQTLKLMGRLARHDAGTLYNATTNLISSDSGILAVQRGIMLKTQNSRIQQIAEHIGQDTAWTCYYRLAMGIDEATTALPPWEARAVAALHLHLETITLLRPIIHAAHRPVIEDVEAKIRAMLQALVGLIGRTALRVGSSWGLTPQTS